MPPPPPPGQAVLIDELVEEFLVRLPPDDPALLARAALVSRQWYRVVTGAAFRRRFREFHRSMPPLLGYILADHMRFVPMSSFRPPQTRRRAVRAISSSHGRVLLHRSPREDPHAPCSAVKDVDVLLSVWHLITDEQLDLPVAPVRATQYMGMANWDAAIVCAGGDGCDHLHCRFEVVFVGNREDRNFSCFYSSRVIPSLPRRSSRILLIRGTLSKLALPSTPRVLLGMKSSSMTCGHIKCAIFP